MPVNHNNIPSTSTSEANSIMSDAAAPLASTTSNTRQRRWYSRLGRILLWSLLVLLIIVLIILAVLYYMAGTDSGFTRITQLANERVAGLSIDNPSGNLQDGISASSVTFSNDSISIKAQELSSGWSLGCLVQRRFCLDDVHVEQLDITTFAATDTEPAAPREGPITLPEIDLPIDVTLSDISVDRLQFQPPGEAPVQIVENIQLSARTDNSLVTIENLSLSFAPYTVVVNGTTELKGQYPIDLAVYVNAEDILPDNVPEGEGKQPLRLHASLSNSVENLRIDALVAGLADVTIAGNVQPLEQNLPLNLSITSDTLGWPIQTKGQLTASNTSIDIDGDMRDYTVSLQTLLDGAQVPNTTIKINALANTDRISASEINIKTLGGELNGSAQASFAQPIAWSTRWHISDIDPSQQVPNLQGELNGNLQASGLVDEQGRWSLKLDESLIEGTLRELPFLLNARLTKGLNDVWFVERITLNNDKNQITVQGLVGDELDLNADLNLTQLQNLLPELAGGFNARLAVSGPVQSPDVFLQAEADVLKFNDILVRALSINADITELFMQDSSVDVSIESVRAGNNDVSNTALSLNGTRNEHSLTLVSDGPQQTSLDLALSGKLDDALNWAGSLNTVDAVVPSHTLSLAAPAQINWQNSAQQINVSPHCWNISDKSSLCLQNAFSSGPEGQAFIALDDYPLQQLNSFLPSNTNVTGVLSANAELGWGSSGPDDRHALVNATIDNASMRTVDALGEPVSFGYETITLNANVAPNDATANLKLASNTLGSAELDLQFDPSQPEPAIDGRLNVQGVKLEVALPFLPDFDEVSGAISAQGNLSGTLTAPAYTGNVVLDSPVLRSELLPLPITGGSVVANIAGQSLSLAGQLLSDEGSIGVEGRGTLDPSNWNASVNLRGQQLNVQSDPLKESIVNHNIQIEANARRVSVTGDVEIPEAVIDVEELPQGAATVSSDVIIIEEEEEEEKSSEKLAAQSNVNLQVALGVSLGDDVTVSAYGLNANLTGDMDVRIRPDNPLQLAGEILVVDGIYKQYGQDLKADGQILFVGPVDATRLAIDAVREIDDEDRTAGLRIQGTANSPQLTLFTEPADKSQDAILSYVVLGRDINETSDQDADLLATAALALAIRGGQNVGDSIASRLGVEEFGLESRGSGDNSELLVSGRLNDRLLLRYGYGVFDADSTLYLRYDLTKKLYLETANSVIESALDLFYSFSF